MKTYKFTINGNKYEAVIKDIEDNVISMELNGTPYDVEFEKVKKSGSVPVVKKENATTATAPVVTTSNSPTVAAPVAPVTSGGAVSVIKSPLPGAILSVAVKEGDTVNIGTKLFVIEAMKMENAIDSDKAGVVKSIKVKAGDAVMEGDILIEIA